MKPAAAEKPPRKEKAAKAGGAGEKQAGTKGERPAKADGADRGGRGRGRGGRGRGRGGRRGGSTTGDDAGGDRPAGDRPPRREFDRRSGSGRTDNEKRKGGGKYNWGDSTEEVTPEIAEVPIPEVAAAAPEAEPTTEEAPAPERETKSSEPVEEEEPDNSITYEEMLAQRQAKLVGQQKQARQVSNDEGRWNDAAPVVSNKKSDNEDNSEETVETNRKSKKVLDIGAFAAPSRGGRGGRGGRGEGGRGGRGGRGARPAAVKLDDENAFPALGQN